MEKHPHPTGMRAGKGPQSRAKHAHQRLKRLVNITKLVFFGLLLISAVLFVLHLFVEKPNEAQIAALRTEGVFLEGITINGVNVSGMTRKEAQSAVQAELDAALSSVNITVRHGTALWVLTAADMAPVTTLSEVLDEAILLGKTGTLLQNNALADEVRETGRSFSAVLVPDHETLMARLCAIGAAVDTAPVEPSAIPVTAAASPAFTYAEGADGYMLNQEALFEEILALMAQGQYSATLTPDLEYVPPTRTVEELKLVTQFRSEFQTSFGGSRAARNEKRVGNIQKAATLLNGAKVEPGEEFNFNAFIGPRTEEGGWPLAPGIVSGERYEDQAGGGICQVSSTIYCAAMLAQMTTVERTCHMFVVTYLPYGLDATVSWPGPDYKFRNDRDYPVKIVAYCNDADKSITIEIWGTDVDGTQVTLRHTSTPVYDETYTDTLIG